MILWKTFEQSLPHPKPQWPPSKLIWREGNEEDSDFRKCLKMLLKMEEFILQFFNGENKIV